jgi:hypothetical protein
MDSEIAHADSPDLALFHSLDQRFPGSQSTLRSFIRCMKQIQVDILQLRFLQTLVNAPLRVLVVDAFRRDLGSVEELFSWDASTKQAFCRGILIAVYMRGVDVAVARFDGVSNNVLCYICWAGNGVSSVYCLESIPRYIRAKHAACYTSYTQEKLLGYVTEYSRLVNTCVSLFVSRYLIIKAMKSGSMTDRGRARYDIYPPYPSTGISNPDFIRSVEFMSSCMLGADCVKCLV